MRQYFDGSCDNNLMVHVPLETRVTNVDFFWWFIWHYYWFIWQNFGDSCDKILMFMWQNFGDSFNKMFVDHLTKCWLFMWQGLMVHVALCLWFMQKLMLIMWQNVHDSCNMFCWFFWQTVGDSHNKCWWFM